MRWLKRLRPPWRRRTQPARSDDPTEALRELYQDYQGQQKRWGYSVISSLCLMAIFIVFGLFTVVNLWVITIPLVAIFFSVFQTYRCKDIVRVLRQARVIQKQCDWAREEAERQRQAEEGTGEGSPLSAAHPDGSSIPPIDPDDPIHGSSPAPA